MSLPRRRKHRTLEERRRLYSQLKELQAQGVLGKDIAKELDITTGSVHCMTGNPPSSEEYVPDLTPRADLAYLVGAYLGDGRTAGEEDKKVRFRVANPAFAGHLNDLVARVLRATPKPVIIEQGFHCVNYDTAVLYDFLQQAFENYKHLIDSYPTSFLQGFFDAEGHATQELDQQVRALRLSGLVLQIVTWSTLARLVDYCLTLGSRQGRG